MKGDSWTVNSCSWEVSLFYAWIAFGSVAFWSDWTYHTNKWNGVFLALKGTGVCLCCIHYLSKFRPSIALLCPGELQVRAVFQPAPSKMFLVTLWSSCVVMPRDIFTASQNQFSRASVGFELGFLGWSSHCLVPVIGSVLPKCSALMILVTAFIVIFSRESKDLVCLSYRKSSHECVYLYLWDAALLNVHSPHMPQTILAMIKCSVLLTNAAFTYTCPIDFGAIW